MYRLIAKYSFAHCGSLKLQMRRWDGSMWVDEGWIGVTSAPIVSAFECAVLELMAPLN